MSKIYYGAGPIPKNKVKATMKQAVEANQVRMYGLYKIDPIILRTVKHVVKNYKEQKMDLLKEIFKLKGRLTRIEDEMDSIEDEKKKSKLKEEYLETTEQIKKISLQIKRLEPEKKEEPQKEKFNLEGENKRISDEIDEIIKKRAMRNKTKTEMRLYEENVKVNKEIEERKNKRANKEETKEKLRRTETNIKMTKEIDKELKEIKEQGMETVKNRLKVLDKDWDKQSLSKKKMLMNPYYDQYYMTYINAGLTLPKRIIEWIMKNEDNDFKRRRLNNMLKEIEEMEEQMKEEPKKDSKKDKITFLEYIEPNDNKDDDNLLTKGRRDILDKFGDELDKIIDINKYNDIIKEIPNLDEILYKMLNWLEKKQGKKEDLVTEYRTFIKKVVYNMFLKKVLNNMKLNTFDGIVISNIIGSDIIFNQFYDNNTKYSIIRTFIEEKPFIPKRELTTNLKKIDNEYIMYGQKNVF